MKTTKQDTSKQEGCSRFRAAHFSARLHCRMLSMLARWSF